MRFNKNGQMLSSAEVPKQKVLPDPDVKKLMNAYPDNWFNVDDKNNEFPLESNKTQTKNSNVDHTQTENVLSGENKPENKKGILKRLSEKWEIIKNSRLYALFIIFNLVWTVVFSYFVLINTKATKDGLGQSHAAFSQIVDNWRTSALSYIYVESGSSKHSWLGIDYQWEYSGNLGQYYGFTQSYYTNETPLAKLYGDYISFNFYDDSAKFDVKNGCPSGYRQCGGSAIDVNYSTCVQNGSKCPITNIFAMKLYNLNYSGKTNNINNIEFNCPLYAICTFCNPYTQNISNFTIEGQIYKTPSSSYLQVETEGNTWYVILTSDLSGWWFSLNTSSNAAVLYPYREWLDGNYSTVIFWSENHNDYPIVEFAVNEFKMCNDKTQENVTPGRKYSLLGDISYAYDKKIDTPCADDSNNFSWIILDSVSELQYCINNGLFSSSQHSYCPCTDYPYYLYYRRYIGLSPKCRFLMPEVNDFVSKIKILFKILEGIVILIYINWGMSGIFLIMRVCFFTQKHCLKGKGKNIIATKTEMGVIENCAEKIDTLYGFCNASIQLGFKLASFLIVSHSSFTSDFRSHSRDCVIDSYITTNVFFLETNLKDVLTNVYVNLGFGCFNFLLAVISLGNCCIETKKQVKNMSDEDKKKAVMILAKII